MDKQKKKEQHLLTILSFILVGVILMLFPNKIILLLILFCFQLIDIYLTDRAIKMGAKELNPFGVFLQKKFKQFWFIPAIIFFILFIFFIYPTEEKFITFMIGFYLMIIINNIRVFKEKKEKWIKKNKKYMKEM